MSPKPRQPNLLHESGLPLVYPLAAPAERVLAPPDPEDHDVAARAVVRSLTVMQKEAVVTRTGSNVAWRLASDEGPYLQGRDFAPAPLAFLTTGLAVDVLASVERRLLSAGLATTPLRVVLDSRFTIEGSLPRGTMVGGAEPPNISVFTGGSDRTGAAAAVLTGVLASATAGLAGPALSSAFTLTSHGRQIPVGRVTPLDEPPPPADDLPPRFPTPGSAPSEQPIIVKTFDVGDRTPDAGVSLQQEQRRELHLEAEAQRRADGLVVVETRVHRPNGSTFAFLSEEPEGLGGRGRAPDAVTYISAGIGFCFMTQFGRYAKILRRELGDYRIVQDTRFSIGDPAADPPVGGRASAPRTHVYLAPDGSDDFARHAVDVSEQTCFLHALCRTELRPKVRTLPHG